jgi:hypothetical protein
MWCAMGIGALRIIWDNPPAGPTITSGAPRTTGDEG